MWVPVRVWVCIGLRICLEDSGILVDRLSRVDVDLASVSSDLAAWGLYVV